MSKRISIVLSMVVALYGAFTLSYAKAVNLYEWYGWWREGAVPNTSNGSVIEIYELRLKEAGAQMITFSLEEGSSITLTTFLEKSQFGRIGSVVAVGDYCRFSYYPNYDDKTLVTSINCQGREEHKRRLIDTGWTGFMGLVLLVFYVLAMLGFSYLTFLIYKGRFLDSSDQ